MRAAAIGAAIAVAGLTGGCVSMGQAKDGFSLVYLGRDAIFVENATIAREGAVVSFRALRVQDSQFRAGEAVFLGGYDRSRIDCSARTFKMVSFQSLKPGFVAGPEAATRGRSYEIAGGSPEEGIAKAVCDGKPLFKVRVKTVAEAVAVGRKRLDELG